MTGAGKRLRKWWAVLLPSQKDALWCGYCAAVAVLCLADAISARGWALVARLAVGSLNAYVAVRCGRDVVKHETRTVSLDSKDGREEIRQLIEHYESRAVLAAEREKLQRFTATRVSETVQ